MEKVIIALVGVVVGAALTIGRELFAEWRKDQKDAQYLAIRIVCIFDRFIEGCVAVVGDDGLFHGQPDAEGYSRIQVEEPSLDIQLTDVNWKALPSELMYEILSFPNSLDDAKHIVSTTFDLAAFPPSYDEGFEERQYQFSKLGLNAVCLVEKLRSEYNLPARTFDHWNPIEYMKNEKMKIEELRNKRAAAINANIAATKNA